jgi:hypothetical protein
MSLRRLRLTLPAVVLSTLLAAACGTASSSSETTPAPNTTPWRTLAPVSANDPGSSIPLEGGTINYTVRWGDSPNAIAGAAGGGCSGADIMGYNPSITSLAPGQILKIPANCLAAGVTEESLNAVTPDTAPGTTDKNGKPATTIGDVSVYRVVDGDYWPSISKKTGCPVKLLKAANPGVVNIKTGQKIKVPISCDTRG